LRDGFEHALVVELSDTRNVLGSRGAAFVEIRPRDHEPRSGVECRGHELHDAFVAGAGVHAVTWLFRLRSRSTYASMLSTTTSSRRPERTASSSPDWTRLYALERLRPSMAPVSRSPTRRRSSGAMPAEPAESMANALPPHREADAGPT